MVTWYLVFKQSSVSSREPVTLWEFQILQWDLPCHMRLAMNCCAHVLKLMCCLSNRGRTLSMKCLHVPLKYKGQKENISTVHIKKCMVFWKEAFQFVRNLFSSILEKKLNLVRFSPSEVWRLLTSPYSFKIFSLGVPEEYFSFLGGEGPLVICKKRTSLIASSSFYLPSSPGFSMTISMISERLESVAVKLYYSLNTVYSSVKLIPKFWLLAFRYYFSGF